MMRRLRNNCIIICMMACFSSIQLLAFDGGTEIFPVPDNLKPNVQFWIKIFSEYNSNQFVIHDAENLNIIYEVVNANEFDNDFSVYSRSSRISADRVRENYRSILLRLASLGPVDPAALAPEELKVYNLYQAEASPERFLRAAENIRTQQGLRDRFRQGLIVSGKYAPHIQEIFAQYGIPQELMALPHVESSFNLRAYSKFGAAGIWQFTRSTGRRFLRIDYLVDERFDPYLSTEAAAKLLRENYETLGAWPLAITAYNHGVNGMQRAVSQLGTTDLGVIVSNYKSRNFKFASSNFYAEFLAAVEVRKNYKQYFGDIQFDSPDKYLVFEVPNNVKLATLVKQLNLSVKDIERLNPSLRKTVLSSSRALPKGFALRIPHREDFDARLVAAQIPTPEKEEPVAADWYQVQPGDNLAAIARRYQTTVDRILELNDIDNPHKIRAGQVLKIKTEASPLAAATTNMAAESAASKTTTTSEIQRSPVSQPQPAALAEQRDRISAPPTVPTPEPKPSRPLSTPKDVVAESKATTAVSVPASSTPTSAASSGVKPTFGYIYVQPEETLGHYADWLGVPTQLLRNLNGLRYGVEIHLNQKIKVPYSVVSEKEFQQKRYEYHRGIEEDFFASFKVDSVVVHKIKRGENIWYLCNQVYEIPYWLVLKYNPNKNLEQLSSDDELLIPVVGKIENGSSS
ncbi:MAG: LysM peptidoglycan-binding domain-containing protein [candidate division KSB1 bacterium]|nr:LysM peptidoglycan-binding domain-containing protein [candidate division KSB1 bacterium]MDZ7319958.1 LysM peptidoglycan-binding domain-containing protein [candidate division KSB1 bacterium]MDZ7341697.1 LysM peptidoglycan-binding domain-containing protein [candidate division KSB1 bacterium]